MHHRYSLSTTFWLQNKALVILTKWWLIVVHEPQTWSSGKTNPHICWVLFWEPQNTHTQPPRDTKIIEKLLPTLLNTPPKLVKFGFQASRLHTINTGPFRKVPFSSWLGRNFSNVSCQRTWHYVLLNRTFSGESKTYGKCHAGGLKWGIEVVVWSHGDGGGKSVC